MPSTLNVRVVNDTGKVASDVHVQFTGTGGSVFVDPTQVQVFGPPAAPGGPPVPIPTPAPTIPSNPPAVSNEADIEWPTGTVPPGGEIHFPASTNAGPLQIQNITWSFPMPATVAPGTGAPASVPMVEHPLGTIPFIPEHWQGVMTAGGVQPDVAAQHANTLNTVIHSVHTPATPLVLPETAIKSAIGELIANPTPSAIPNVASIVRNATQPASLPAVQPAQRTAPATVIDAAVGIVNAFSDGSVLSPTGATALQQLIANASAVATAFEPALAADPTFQDLQAKYTPFARMLAAGSELAGNPNTFLRWRDQFAELTTALAGAFEAVQGEIMMASQPLTLLVKTLEPFTAAQLVTPWQGPVLMALSQMQITMDYTAYLTVCRGLLPKLKNNCPPCGADCPYGAWTTYETIAYSNPQNCTSRTVSIPIGETDYYYTFWTKTCTWDAKVHWKQVFSCYSNMAFRALRFPACCTSIKEWDTNEKQSRQLTQGTATVGNKPNPKAPAFPNTASRDNITGGTGPAPNPAPPAPATTPF